MKRIRIKLLEENIQREKWCRMKRIVIVLFLLLMVGCAKNDVTLNDFIEIGTFNGYIIEENKKGYENYDYINTIYYAINRENAYDIQFLELKNDDYAKRFFETNKEEISKLRGNNTYVKTISLSNYSLYHLENDTSYMLVLRSKNNIIYIDASIGYIKEIEEFLEELDIDY